MRINIKQVLYKDQINKHEKFNEEINQEIQNKNKKNKVKAYNLSVHFSVLCKFVYLIFIAQLKRMHILHFAYI